MRTNRGARWLVLGSLIAVAFFLASPLLGPVDAPSRSSGVQTDLEASIRVASGPGVATIVSNSFDRVWSPVGRGRFTTPLGDLAQSATVRTALVVALVCAVVARCRRTGSLSRPSDPRAPPVHLQP